VQHSGVGDVASFPLASKEPIIECSRTIALVCWYGTRHQWFIALWHRTYRMLVVRGASWNFGFARLTRPRCRRSHILLRVSIEHLEPMLRCCVWLLPTTNRPLRSVVRGWGEYCLLCRYCV
jgi:hypothetical protein